MHRTRSDMSSSTLRPQLRHVSAASRPPCLRGLDHLITAWDVVWVSAGCAALGQPEPNLTHIL